MEALHFYEFVGLNTLDGVEIPSFLLARPLSVGVTDAWKAIPESECF
jgi:hypothetical protein